MKNLHKISYIPPDIERRLNAAVNYLQTQSLSDVTARYVRKSEKYEYSIDKYSFTTLTWTERSWDYVFSTFYNDEKYPERISII